MKILLRSFARSAFAALALLQALPALAQEARATVQRNFLWEVSSPANRAYLYGTVHAGKAEWYPLPAAVEEAFQDSKVLVVEADVTDVDAVARAGPLMTLTPPDSLRNHVDAADYERFRKLLPRYGFPEPQAAQMKPFMAVSMLVFSEWARLGYLPQYGIDGYLIKRARAEVKPVVEIEGVEMQVRLMDSLSDQEVRTLFNGTLKALETGLTADQVNGMMKAWQSGDPDLLLRIARQYNDTVPGAKEFEEKFIWGRHEEMARKIEGYLNASGDRHFIAVGSLHLAGERGLVAMLRKRGYVVKQK